MEQAVQEIQPNVQRSDEYLALVEAVRVEGKNTHRTLFRLGEVSELRESGQLDRIVKALATYANGTYVEAGEIEGLGSPSFGAVAAAWSYFRRLGLEEHFSSLGDGPPLTGALRHGLHDGGQPAHRSILQE